MIILASKSPRRKEILSSMGYEFEIKPSIKDEIFDSSLSLDKALEKVALAKAKEVYTSDDDCILSADTIVVLDDTVLGKPKDEQDAIDTLKRLSNRKHQVKTGVSILYKGKEISFVDTTDVYFKELSEQSILEYVHSGKCMDKAGSYGIQECDFVDHIVGSYTNVVGLPQEMCERVLREIIC